MDKDVNFSRRHFLAFISSLTIALLPGFASVNDRDELANCLGCFFQRKSMTPGMIGRRYLAKVPEEKSETWLMDVLFGGLGPVAGHQFSLLSSRVGRLRRDDFVRGDLVEIDGWLLARTEARLCALAAICTAG
jgi:hypothetical protein